MRVEGRGLGAWPTVQMVTTEDGRTLFTRKPFRRGETLLDMVQGS